MSLLMPEVLGVKLPFEIAKVYFSAWIYASEACC